MATFENVINQLTSSGSQMDQVVQMLMATPVTNPQELYINLERLIQQGAINPEQAHDVLIEKSNVGEISADPVLINEQYNALRGLQDIVQSGGLTAMDRAHLETIRKEEETQIKGARDASMIAAQQRGVAGGGLEQLQRMMAEQSGAERASSRGTQVAAMAQQRALEALQQAGALAGSMRSQGFSEDQAKAAAQDAIAQFNASNQQQTSLANLAQRGQAQMFNAEQAQRVAELNAQQQLTEQQSQIAAKLASQGMDVDRAKSVAAGLIQQSLMNQSGWKDAGQLMGEQQQLAQQAEQMNINKLLQTRGMDITEQANLATQGLRGREIDIGERQGLTQSEIEREKLAQSGTQFGQNMTLEQQRLAQQKELEKQRLDILAKQAGQSGELSERQQWGELISAAPALIGGIKSIFGGSSSTPQQQSTVNPGYNTNIGYQYSNANPSLGNTTYGQNSNYSAPVSGLSGLWSGGGSDGVGNWGVLGDIGGGISDMFGSIFSDVNLKEGVSELSDQDVDELLGRLTGYKYQYKDDPSNGVYPGVMAQDLEKGSLGEVHNTPNGKTVSYGPQDIHAMTAALANIHDRVKKIEGMK